MEKKRKFVHLYKLLPNMLTLFAICLGITSIRYALIGKFEIATILVVFAVFLDSIDGRVARFLGSSSDFGAHLDSLADIINFGVSPAIIIYLWSLSSILFGWGVVLIYVICGTLRLARFNVINIEYKERSLNDTHSVQHLNNEAYKMMVAKHQRNFFIGLPIPAAAVLMLVPMISTFKIFTEHSFSPIFITIYTILISLMMISSIPIFGGKYVKISPRLVPFIVAVIWFILGAIVIFPWFTIPILSIIYVCLIFIGCIYYRVKLKNLQKTINHSASYDKTEEIIINANHKLSKKKSSYHNHKLEHKK